MKETRDKIMQTLVHHEAYHVPVVSSYESKLEKLFDEQRVQWIWVGPIAAAT
jgi:hypothetical protein